MKKPFFSIGIIFKNEIRCLERCLKSLQPLRDAVPCELVMADTGSDDGSREVAEKYADILFDFPWIDDFAAARNAVMDRCSGAWYFSIDADEWLDEDVAELVRFSKLKKFPRDFAGIPLRNFKDPSLEKSSYYVDFTATRLANMKTGVRYKGCIHESWSGPNGEPLFISILTDTRLYHDGYLYSTKAEAKAKYDRNMPLLKKKLAENPDDMQTLVECIDTARAYGTESIDYVRQAVAKIEERCPGWERFGSVVLRDAVVVAQANKLPELWSWIELAEKLFPKSTFFRIDVAYCALSSAWSKDDFAGCIRWGEMYRKGLADIAAGEFDIGETLRGILEHQSPYWEIRMKVLLAESYLNEKKPEGAYEVLQSMNGADLDDMQIVTAYANMLLRIHRTTMLDAPAQLASFWDQIRQPVPNKEIAEQRRLACLRRLSDSFTTKYREDELQREDFIRFGFTLLTVLKEDTSFGIAAEIMQTEDVNEISEKLSKIEDWTTTPIQALTHALECGAAYPLPEKPLKMEEINTLTDRLSKEPERFYGLFRQAANRDYTKDLQTLCWTRGMTLAAIRICEWKEEEKDTVLPFEGFQMLVWDDEKRLEVAKTFAAVEGSFLPVCYAPEVLTEKNLFVLSPVSRFGFYLSKAFAALRGGDKTGYVRFLRMGLQECEDVKDMVEFLTEHTPELREAQTPQPSEELKALADQVRKILANYAPDDPAVSFLKQSDAYQKVSYLIEGTAVPVMGGALQ